MSQDIHKLVERYEADRKHNLADCSQYEWLTKDIPENFAEYCTDYFSCS